MYQIVTILLACHLSYLLAMAPDDTYVCINDVGQVMLHTMVNYCKVLLKHTDAVTAVCWHPKHDGILASGGQDATIYVWNVKNGQPIEAVQDSRNVPINLIKRLCWHPDGRLLVMASDELMCIWDAQRNKPIVKWLANNNIVEAIDLSGDASNVAIGLDNSQIYIFNVQKEKAVAKFSTSAAISSQLAWHSDNERLASGHVDHYIRIWKIVTNRLLCKWLGHDQQVTALAWSPDGTKLASGSEDKKICIWDAQSGQKLHVLLGHIGWIRALSWHPDNRLLASGAGRNDKNVLIWDTLKELVQSVLPGYVAGVRALAWHKNGNLLASGSDDRAVCIWDWQRLKDLDIRKIISARLTDYPKRLQLRESL